MGCNIPTMDRCVRHASADVWPVYRSPLLDKQEDGEIILLAALGVNSSFAQRYPTLKHVDVRARVTYDFRDHFFYYSYSLANGVESIGSVESFRIDLAGTANTIQYDSIGLRFADDDFVEGEFRKNYSALSRETVLVGFQSLPSGWSVLWGQRLATISKDTEFIAPGHSVDGIIMMSRSLPGIRKCVVVEGHHRKAHLAWASLFSVRDYRSQFRS